MVFSGTVNGAAASILKDDGCNTNVISSQFLARNRDIFDITPALVDVLHSKAEFNEVGTEMISNATIEIGDYKYTGNWIVADCRYDVLLGMPWHHSELPKTEYDKRQVTVKNNILSASPISRKEAFAITNIGVKRFRRLLRRPKRGTEIFQVMQMSTKRKCDSRGLQEMTTDKEVLSLVDEFSDVFKSQLPPELPPRRSVDHAIEIESNKRPPHRSLYQLSPAELVAAREYVENLLQSGKIRPSKSPFGAPLFFVKEPGKALRGVVDYRALNRITKRNSAPLPRCDEMFD